MRVEVEDLSLRYGETTALDGVTFTLEPNRIYGLLGRNGSGKTSLLSVLGAFRRESGGRVRVDGRPVFENPAVTSRISLIRESGETTTIGTVQDALYFAGGLRPGWDDEYAHSLVEAFRLPLAKNVKGMSRGQRSALGIVIGLAARAPLTMFDEAYLGLDAPSRGLFYDLLLADYMANPRTIILSTHLIDEVSPLFEEVLIVDAGRLVTHEETGSLLSKGLSITGPVAAVDAFTAGLRVLGVKQLGPTKSATVYGDLDDAHRARAAQAGLELGPIGMQDLFTHLTGGTP